MKLIQRLWKLGLIKFLPALFVCVLFTVDACGQQTYGYYTHLSKSSLDNDSVRVKVTLEEFIKRIEKIHDISFIYKSALINNNYVPSLLLESDSLIYGFGSYLRSRGLIYEKASDNTYVIIPDLERKMIKESDQKQTGTVRGVIVDSRTQNPLAGANIVLKGTTRGVATARDGSYEFNRVPSGEQTFIVSFIGYQQKQVTLEVEGDEAITRNIQLESRQLEGGEIVVEGLRGGQAKALHEKKQAENIKYVISSDDVGELPDKNVSEALQRVPGVAITRDKGEGEFVSIRGMNENLNEVTINGMPLPSTEPNVRALGLDGVSSWVLGSLEVVKSPTPDIAASGIGGVIQLQSQSAFDFNQRVLRATAEGTFQKQSTFGREGFSEITPRLGLTFADKYADNRLGVMASISYDQRIAPETQLDIKKFSIGTNTETGEDVLWAGNWKTRVIEEDRKRLSSVLNLEYRLDDNITASVRTLFSRFHTDRLRSQLARRFDDALFEQANDPSRVMKLTETSATVTDIFVNNNTQGVETVENLVSVIPEINGSFGRFDWNVHGSISSANRTEDIFKVALTRDIQQATLDWSESMYRPVLSIDSGEDLANPGVFTNLDQFKITDNYESNDSRGSVGFDVSYEVGSQFFDYVKTGYNFFSRTKENIPNNIFYNGGPTDLSVAQFPGLSVGAGFFGPQVPAWIISDLDQAEVYFNNNFDSFQLMQGKASDMYANTLNDYSGRENVHAGYVMGNFNFGNLSAVGGIRVENTNFEGDANQLRADEFVLGKDPSPTPITQSESYTNLLPSLNLRYDLNQNFVLRFAASRTLMRPAFGQLAAKRSIDYSEETIVSGNPELDPFTSTNLDFSAAYYPGSIGILSVGVFHKSIDAFIFNQTSTIDGGTFDGFEQTRPENAESSSMIGIELTWQQELTMLPSPFDGLGFSANYTYINSDQTVDSRPGEEFNLVGQSDNIINSSLSWQKYGFTARLAYNYRSDYLLLIAGSPEMDEIVESRGQLDAFLSYQYDKWEVFGEVVNLNTSPRTLVKRGLTRRVPRSQRVNDLRTHFGVRVNL